MIQTTAAIMATIMPREVNNTVKGNRIKYSQVAITFAGLFSSTTALAQSDLKITAQSEAEVIYQDVQTETDGNLSLTTVSIVPSLIATYSSRTFSGNWSSTVTHLERENDTSGEEDTYAEYRYTAQWQPFDEYLLLQANGALNYQNTSSSSYLLTDFVTNSEGISKTRTNTLSGTLQFINGDWITALGSAAYSVVESEESSTNSTGLDNDSTSLTGTLANGDRARRLFWTLTGSYQDTSRSTTSSGDFFTREGEFTADAMLFSDWALRVTAFHEANQINSTDNSDSATRQFNSYGAGITYRQSAERYIALTANRSDSDTDENETYVGLDIAWALSSRTSVAGSYDRRFYGESAAAQISYNTKYFRSSFSYNEDVTTTSRLLTDSESLGVFVCASDASSISDCFQPSSLAYDLGAGEQFVELTSQNLEFDDSVIIYKSANTQIGYQFSRLTLGLTWRYTESEYLEEDRLRRNYSAGTDFSYDIGSYTSLTGSITYANIEERGTSTTAGVSENINSTLGLSRTFGEHLTTSLNLSYLTTSGNLSQVSLYGNDYTDRRITFSVSYEYE